MNYMYSKVLPYLLPVGFMMFVVTLKKDYYQIQFGMVSTCTFYICTAMFLMYNYHINFVLKHQLSFGLDSN